MGQGLKAYLVHWQLQRSAWQRRRQKGDETPSGCSQESQAKTAPLHHEHAACTGRAPWLHTGQKRQICSRYMTQGQSPISPQDTGLLTNTKNFCLLPQDSLLLVIQDLTTTGMQRHAVACTMHQQQMCHRHFILEMPCNSITQIPAREECWIPEEQLHHEGNACCGCQQGKERLQGL